MRKNKGALDKELDTSRHAKCYNLYVILNLMHKSLTIIRKGKKQYLTYKTGEQMYISPHARCYPSLFQ